MRDASLRGGSVRLVGHLEEQQVRELLDVVAVAHAVVAENLAVVPELLDEGARVLVHGLLHDWLPTRTARAFLPPRLGVRCRQRASSSDAGSSFGSWATMSPSRARCTNDRRRSATRS